MKIVVTGASGFLGGRLVKFLATKGHKVYALSRNPARKAEFAELGISLESDKPYSQAMLSQTLEGADCLVHCAALSSPWGSYDEFYEANVVLTKRLTDAAIHHKVKRLVNISTPSIYFDFRDRLMIKESDPLPLEFVNDYARTKLEAEQYVLGKNGQGIESISLRPRAIIGAEDQVLFPRLMRAYLSGKLRIIGSGENRADFTSVQNLLAAIELCLHAPTTACGLSYNISNGTPNLLWEEINFLIQALGHTPIRKRMPYALARTLARVLEKKSTWFSGDEPALTQYSVGVLAKDFSLDICLAKDMLGYEPKVSTRAALHEFINWYSQKKNG